MCGDGPQIYTAVAVFLDDPDPAIRKAALGVVSALAELADVQVFHHVLAVSTDQRERAVAVLSLGARGEDTTSLRGFLTAVADNDRNWGDIADKDILLREAGLPHGRNELRRLIQTQG